MAERSLLSASTMPSGLAVVGAVSHPGSLPCPGILGIKVLVCKCPCVRIQRPGAEGRCDGDRIGTYPPAESIAPQLPESPPQGEVGPFEGGNNKFEDCKSIKKQHKLTLTAPGICSGSGSPRTAALPLPRSPFLFLLLTSHASHSQEL